MAKTEFQNASKSLLGAAVQFFMINELQCNKDGSIHGVMETVRFFFFFFFGDERVFVKASAFPLTINYDCVLMA